MRFVEVDGLQFELFPRSVLLTKALIDPLRNYLLPARFLRRLMGRSNSRLIAESMVRPGGWRSMEIVYKNAPPVDFLDKMAVRYNAVSMAARNRRKFVTQKLTSLITHFASAGPVSILGVGAGPGLQVQDAVVRSEIERGGVAIHLIDLDSDSFEYGMEQARQRGLADDVQFVQGDARAIHDYLPDIRPQIVKMVGIVEYLTDEQLKELLQAVHGIMADGGALVTHGLVDHHNTGPFLARVFNLRHCQRTKQQILDIVESCGFRDSECFVDPMNVYPIVTTFK